MDSLGNVVWGTSGIHISGPEFLSFSNGIALAALADGGVVSCFADASDHCIAVKIDDNGNFEWGEDGITALETNSCLRTQIVAEHNGGFWVMAHDETSLHFRYYHSDGTPGCDQITISDENSASVAFGQMVLDEDDNVFAVYLKQQHAVSYYYNKSLYVAKYATNGSQLSQEEQLMDAVSISGEICHSACPDGQGGGYAWISHPAFNNLFEVYVFHFDNNGRSTISAPTGLIASQPDGENFHLNPAAALHPTSHDLLVTFVEVDALSQTRNGFRVNRITANGAKLWGDSGIVVIPMTDEDDLSHPIMDAFPDGTGASIAYKLNGNSVAALAIDANGTIIWHTTIATPDAAEISLCDASSSYHNDQTIFAWQGSRNNAVGMYGQNLHPDGTLGPQSGVSIEDTEESLLTICQSGDCLHVGGADIQQIELVNIVGQLVKSSVGNVHTLSLRGLPQGIYVARVRTNDGKFVSQKVMVR